MHTLAYLSVQKMVGEGRSLLRENLAETDPAPPLPLEKR